MDPRLFQPGDREIRMLQKNKQTVRAEAKTIGPDLIEFFKKDIQKRQTKLEKIAVVWEQLIPKMLADHCSLETLDRGKLMVLVDSSSHLYELDLLMRSGLEKQLSIACKSSGLRKIVLRVGKWYDGNDERDRKLRFE